MKSEQTIKFNFDVSTFRLIGRELITDRITALVELVKNSYDANAEHVTIRFENVGRISDKSKIIISDDGTGMSFNDIKNKWMIIGTTSKRITRVSPAPYCRLLVGKKGIGRFAVDKLGSKLVLKTTQKGTDTTVCVQNDWGEYEDIEKEQLELDFQGRSNDDKEKKYFTDIENLCWEEEKIDANQGTTFEISGIREIWTETDIARVYRELSKLISPYHTVKYPFNITICAPETKDYSDKTIQSFAFNEVATFKCELNFNESNEKQESLQFVDGKMNNILVAKQKCGFLKVRMYYFDENAKIKFKKAYSNDRIDGVKIYRDGILTTPFTENVDPRDDRKDILGIDKRRWSGFFDKIDTHDLLGWIEISDSQNQEIIEATNRQGFVDNEAWKSLKDFIIEQIACIEQMKKWQKDNAKKMTEENFAEAKDSFSRAKQLIGTIATEDPQTHKKLAALNAELGKVQGSLNKAQSDMAKTNKEKERVEDLLFSLVSIQTYAGMLSHIVRTMIGKIKDRARYLRDKIFEPKYNEVNKQYAQEIYGELNSLDKSVDFLLRYSKDGKTIEDVSVKQTLVHLLNDIYDHEFKVRNIQSEIIMDDEISIRYNLKAFEDIFDNLISNSFKAFDGDDEEVHCIKITVKANKDSLVIFYSNNGKNIPDEEQSRIFNVFYTTTADQGGAGLGLYIIKTRLESINGSIRVIENEFKPKGATFEITIPFKGVK
ncbi:histidine kinase [Spirochaetia bacterium]|nr:histidine kinase [Spirochaetia bacterium]